MRSWLAPVVLLFSVTLLLSKALIFATSLASAMLPCGRSRLASWLKIASLGQVDHAQSAGQRAFPAEMPLSFASDV